MTIETLPDTWLTSTLGYSAFKVVLPLDGTTEPIERGRLSEPGLYYTKLPTHSVKQLHALEQIGFKVVDVSVTLERSPDRSGAHPAGCKIVNFDSERHGDVARIGEESFVYSRFHLDPEISNAVANRIKRVWVENCMSGKRGDRLTVAESDGRAVGFLAELHVRNDGQCKTIIDLVGVAPQHQGRGLGRALVQNVIHRSLGFAETVHVGTQAANVPSLRLYESTGFRIIDTNYVLHAHL